MRLEYVEEYKKLKPLDKNNVLVELFQQLPLPLNDQFPDMDDWVSMPGKGAALEELARRRRSENRTILVDRLESLLLLSNTTVPFQAHILVNYAQKYIDGVSPIDIFTHLFHGQLFQDYQISPGIFAQPSAKEIERRIYHAEQNARLRMRSMFQKMYEERGFEYTDQPIIPQDKLSAILNTNPNDRFSSPENYARDLEQAESAARHHRITYESWSNEFFKKYSEEI
jgi:hypothetical protein